MVVALIIKNRISVHIHSFLVNPVGILSAGFLFDFLFDFCIFHRGQPQGAKIRNADFMRFFGVFSPRVNCMTWVQVPPAPPNKTPIS